MYAARLALPLLLVTPVLFGCGSSASGPNAAQTVEVVAEIDRLRVVHDCDPKLDDPGDFNLLVQVSQDTDPGDGQSFAPLGSTEFGLAANSGDVPNVSTETRVAVSAVPKANRPVRVEVRVRELDNNVVDLTPGGGDYAEIYRVWVLDWNPVAQCWWDGSKCLVDIDPGTPGLLENWGITTRNDVFDLLNPDDEGCQFNIDWRIGFTNQE
jgi:hypothetical protein